MPRKKPYRRNSLRLPNHDYSSPGWYFVTLNIQDREHLFGEIKQRNMWLNDFGRVAAKTWSHLEELYDHIGLDAWVIMPDHIHGIICIFENDAPPSLPYLRGIKRIKSPTPPEPTRAEPTETEPARDGPIRTEPTRDEPTRDEPTRDEPTRDEPTRDEPTRDEPTRDEPTRDEPTRDEPTSKGRSRTAPTAPTASTPPTVLTVSTPAITPTAPTKSIGRIVGAYKTMTTKQINQLRGTEGERIWQRDYYDRIIKTNKELRNVRRYIHNNPLKWWQTRRHLP